jgi:hypothetical protein
MVEVQAMLGFWDGGASKKGYGFGQIIWEGIGNKAYTPNMVKARR